MMDRLDLNVCYDRLGFTEAPFRITPDTDYFFRSPQHLQAYGSFAIRDRQWRVDDVDR